MKNIMNYPLFVFVLSLFGLWIIAQITARLLAGVRDLEPDEREQFGFILGATLTLLGLIIGFSFSMAIGRYDQRKNYEEEEANAIGTEYLRSGVLPGSSPEKVQALIRQYLNQRIMFYQTRDKNQLGKVNADTARLQNEMWAEVKSAALLQPTAVSALAVAGMNDVLNSQGYTQAAWWNRIPIAAWDLMGAIAICCNVLLGFTVRRDRAKTRNLLLVILPLVLSISFFLLADLDSPRGGLILIHPQNLLSLAQSLHP